MVGIGLIQIAAFLAVAAIIAPLAKHFQIGAVLGYLLAGIAIGPYGIGIVYQVYDVSNVGHFAEFGVVLLLFLIGLELRPARLWAMRSTIFGLGGAQVGLTALVLAGLTLLLFTSSFVVAAYIGLSLALSSTAFALQILEEKNEMKTHHGVMGFSILLFQDLTAIPLLALIPVFALFAGASEAASIDYMAIGKAVGILLAVLVGGHFFLNRVHRLIAATKVREAMTAGALLTVVGVAMLMHQAGVPASLGAFIAGAILADSEFRHQIEADLAPFVGLLLGLFFIAIGMSLNIPLLLQKPMVILGLAVGLVSVKISILYVLGRWKGLNSPSARRLALVLSQGGEFAFFLMTSGVSAGFLENELASMMSVGVTISMMFTPLLLFIDDFFRKGGSAKQQAFDRPPEEDGHVIVVGFGRVGQIVARVLRAKKIPFIALDVNAGQIAFLKEAGYNGYLGDATRLDVLIAAQASEASAIVVAVDEVEDSLKIVRLLKTNFPDLPVYVRARNRRHVYWMLDLGVTRVRRETFHSALVITADLLKGLGRSREEVDKTIDTFTRHDQHRLYDDYEHASDMDRLKARAKSSTKELEELFSGMEWDEDAAETEERGK